MERKLTYALAALVLGIMSLPMVQQIWKPAQEKPLYGLHEKPAFPEFNLPAWHSGRYQTALEKYVQHDFGFRNSFVRAHNQYYYSLFGQARANGVVIGREGHLYDSEHIRAVTGADLLPAAVIRAEVRRLRRVQDILNLKGIRFFIALVPGKAEGDPDYLPQGVVRSENTLHRAFVRTADSMGLQVLDLVPWYAQLRQTQPWPMWHPGGIHWNHHGASLAADSLLGYMQRLGLAVPRIHLEAPLPIPVPYEDETDVQDAMNLLLPWPRGSSLAPQFSLSGDVPTRLLAIGDSYYWQPYNQILSRHFRSSQFWFYFDNLYAQGVDPLPRSQVPLRAVLESQDCILLFASTPNLDRLGWGFTETVLDYYERSPDRDSTLQDFIQRMRTTPEWLQLQQSKADAEHVPLDTILYRDAEYLWLQQRIR